MRKVIDHGAVQQALRLSSKLKGFRRYNAPPASHQRSRSRVCTGMSSPSTSLWHAYSTDQCRHKLEEKSDNEEAEPVHGQRKGSIERRLTLSFAFRRAECGTQPEERPDIPGSLLDIIFKRIFVALLERAQRGCTLHHFPHTQYHHPDEVEEQSHHGKELHAPPVYRCVSFTAGFPSSVYDEQTIQARGVQIATATPKDG